MKQKIRIVDNINHKVIEREKEILIKCTLKHKLDIEQMFTEIELNILVNKSTVIAMITKMPYSYNSRYVSLPN